MIDWIAIDLGTCNSAVAIYGSLGPEVLKIDGSELVPSAVMLVHTDNPENPWEVVVGQRALRARERSPRSPYCFTSFKRHLGAVYNPEEGYPEQMCEGVDAEGKRTGMLAYQGYDGFTYPPEELVSYVLIHLREAAEEKLGKSVKNAIICVPAAYNIAQSNALRKAAEMAGFEEVELLHEPVAAAIAHGFKEDAEKVSRIFVVDVGAGTTDCAAFEIGGGLFRVLGTNGAALVGGDDWDLRLRSLVMTLHEFEHENSALATQPDAQRMLLIEAEAAKRRLSEDDVTEFRVEDIDIDKKTNEDVHVIQRISRDHMDEATKELLRDIEDAMTRTMAEAKEKDPRFSVRDIDAVILVGGQTRVKAIQRKVAYFFGKAPRSEVDPELAVVLGAAVQAGIREGRLASITIENITAHSFSIETHDKPEDVATEIVRKGTAYGTKATWWLRPRGDAGQSVMTLKLLQGDSKEPSENIVVWEHHILIDAETPEDVQLDVEIGPSGEPILDVAGVTFGRAA
jgi:molecular chaperone DnaK